MHSTLRILVMAFAFAGQNPSKAEPPVDVTIYPVLINAPFFGASLDVPADPSIPGGGGSGSTDSNINAMWMAGFNVRAKRWFVEGFGVYAAIDASHSAPRVEVDTHTYFFDARAGVGLGGGVSATGGLRRVTSDMTLTLSVPATGSTFSGSAKPGFWDPMVGIHWRRKFNDHFWAQSLVQGGGFGVGMDVDATASGDINWRITRHFEIKAGYTLVHFKFTVADATINGAQRTLTAKQTLHGPIFGLGIPF